MNDIIQITVWLQKLSYAEVPVCLWCVTGPGEDRAGADIHRDGL